MSITRAFCGLIFMLSCCEKSPNTYAALPEEDVWITWSGGEVNLSKFNPADAKKKPSKENCYKLYLFYKYHKNDDSSAEYWKRRYQEIKETEEQDRAGGKHFKRHPKGS